MLVDNGVNGDSRVQKSAESVAAAGWDVTLLGIRPAAGPDEWKIGEAQVRLIPVTLAAGSPYGQIRRSWLRRPLAYPPGKVAGHRVQAAKGRQADLRARRALIAARRRAGQGRPTDTVSRLTLKASSLFAKALGRWTRFRAG